MCSLCSCISTSFGFFNRCCILHIESCLPLENLDFFVNEDRKDKSKKTAVFSQCLSTNHQYKTDHRLAEQLWLDGASKISAENAVFRCSGM